MLFFKSLKDSCPGPDGLPYSCYKALAHFSARIFFRANLILLSGGSLGAGYNIQRGCFIPKNAAIEGEHPRADETRTLGLKNSDNKVITGTNVAQFSPIVAKHACAIQRGFVQGRQFVLNISDLDSISRAQANFDRFPEESILASWDFRAAFPSIKHAWVHAVFRHYGFPNGFCLFLDNLLSHNFAVYNLSGAQAFLYLILVGIIQGCPSAGMLFAVSADPFFSLLEGVQDKFDDLASPDLPLAAFRGCADDIGGAFSSYKLLKIVAPIFQKAEDFADLAVNFKKCAIIPTAFKKIEETREKLSNG